MSTLSKTFVTPEQYLERERQAEYKSEYFQGEVFAMAGGTEAHSLIAVNIVALLRQQTGNRSCRTYNSDLQVQVSATGLYTYPDACVVCGEAKFLDEGRRTLLNPTLIVEVLSPSTEAYNRGRKFEHYRTIESLQEYLMVASDRMQADLFTRHPEGHWMFSSFGDPGDVVGLKSIGCRLVLADIYEKVEF